MRFTRVAPATSDELKRVVLDEIEALLPGCRVIALDLEIPDAGVIDRLAVGRDGSLAIVSFSPEVDGAALSRALTQLEWVLRNISLMRAMGLREAIDAGSVPCCVLVGEHVAASARHLAGWLPRPRISLFTSGFLMMGESRGVLLEPVAPLPAPAESMDRDDPLRALPEGEARSMGRRMLEELRYETGGVPIGVRPLSGGLLFDRDGAPTALLAPLAQGVSFFRVEPSEAQRTTGNMAGDVACRMAVSEILGRNKPPVPRPGLVTPPQGEFQTTPTFSSGSGAAALTPEETAEFERLSTPPRAPNRGEDRRRPSLDLPSGQVQRIRVVEN